MAGYEALAGDFVVYVQFECYLQSKEKTYQFAYTQSLSFMGSL